MAGTFSVSSGSMESGGRGVHVFHVAGSIDATAAEQLDAVLTAALGEGAKWFVLDFAKVEYISSAGLRVLLKLRRAALDAGGGIKVAALRREIRENVFDALGFSWLIGVCVSVAEAAESFGKEGV